MPPRMSAHDRDTAIVSPARRGRSGSGVVVGRDPTHAVVVEDELRAHRDPALLTGRAEGARPRSVVGRELGISGRSQTKITFAASISATMLASRFARTSAAVPSSPHGSWGWAGYPASA